MEIYIYEAASSCAIDGLVAICKSEKTFNTNDVNEAESSTLCQSIKNGEASRDDFEEVSSTSTILAAIVKLCAQSKIFSDKVDLNTYTSKLPGHIQRLLGALFGTMDVLIENDESIVLYIIESLFNILFSGNKQPKLLQSIFEDYRSLFPYCFMFFRRVGRNPKQKLSVWTSVLQREFPEKNTTLPPKRLSNTSPKAEPKDIVKEASSSSSNVATAAKLSALASDWDDEDEDSDSPDRPIPYSQAKLKPQTRIRGNLSSATNIPSVSNVDAKMSVSADESDSGSNSSLNERVNGNDVVEFDDFSDNESPVSTKTVDNQIKKQALSSSPSTQSGLSTPPVNPGTPPHTTAILQSNVEEITLEDLRSAYNANLVNAFGADKINLGRDIRLKLSVPSLADEVLAMTGALLPWEDLLIPAKKYMKRGQSSSIVQPTKLSTSSSSPRIAASNASAAGNKLSVRPVDVTFPKSPATVVNHPTARFTSTSPASSSSRRKSFQRSNSGDVGSSDGSDVDADDDTVGTSNTRSSLKALQSASPRHAQRLSTSPVVSRKRVDSKAEAKDANLRESVQQEVWHDATPSASLDLPPKYLTNQIEPTAVPSEQPSAEEKVQTAVSARSEIKRTFSFLTDDNSIEYDSSNPSTARSGPPHAALSSQQGSLASSISSRRLMRPGAVSVSSSSAGDASPSSDLDEVHHSRVPSGANHHVNQPSNLTLKSDAHLQLSGKSLDGSFYLSDSSMDDSFYGGSGSNNSLQTGPTVVPITAAISAPISVSKDDSIKNRLPTFNPIPPSDDRSGQSSPEKQLLSKSETTSVTTRTTDTHPPITALSPPYKADVGITPLRVPVEEPGELNDSFSDNIHPALSTSPSHGPPRNIFGDQSHLLPRPNARANSSDSQTAISLQGPLYSNSPNSSMTLNRGIAEPSRDLTSLRDFHGSNRDSLRESSSRLSASAVEPPKPPLSHMQQSLHEGLKLQISPPPLSEYASRTGILLESWLEKKSKRTGFWNKKYYVLAETSTADVCVLKVYRRAMESTWGMIHLDMSTVIIVSAIETIRLVNAKSGRDFEISLKPKSSPDAARQSMNDANRPSIDNKPNASAATEAGKGIAQTSLQRSSSGWNVWNETGSVNSDGKENLSGGATLTLRAEDPQVRLMWVTFLQRALHMTLEKQSSSA